MMRLCAMMIAATFAVRPLPQADGPLEPSVQNEVDHAIDMGEQWLGKNFKDIGKVTEPACLRPGEARVPADGPDSKDIKDLMGQLGLTNVQTRVQLALKLVSAQRGGGWWLTETNAVPTRLAVEILKGL